MLQWKQLKVYGILPKPGAIKEDEEMSQLYCRIKHISFLKMSHKTSKRCYIVSYVQRFHISVKTIVKYSNMNARIYAKMALDKDRVVILVIVNF
jgi:hypothetical protein